LKRIVAFPEFIRHIFQLAIYIYLDFVPIKLMTARFKKSPKFKERTFIKADSRKGVNRAKLARLAGEGSLERIERGIYRCADTPL